MTTNKPNYLNVILEKFEHKHDPKLSKENIPDQCGKNADPIYLDFRFSTICSALHEFKERGVSKTQLIEWKKELPIIYPWDCEYCELRQIVNRRFVVFPMGIVMCSKEKHVINALKKCLKYHILLCMRSGSHCYEPYSLCDGFVIDQSRRSNVIIKDRKQIAILEAGCLLGPTTALLQDKGFAFPTGTCANVAIAGLTLGGGLGFLGRKFGLTCDNLISLDMISAKGELMKVSDDENPDLFWAMKGAGCGNFGIVTSFTFKIYPVEDVIILELWWDIDKLYQVLSTWLKWGPESDNNLTTELDIYALNESNTNPHPVLITGLFIGHSKKELKRIIKPLLDLHPLKVKMIKTTYLESVRHFAYATFPFPFHKNKSTYVYKKLPESVIPVIIKYMKKAGSEDRLEFDGLGGAYANKRNDETAYPHRNAKAWIQWIARWQNEDVGAKKLKWVKNFYEEFIEEAGKSVHGAYFNCPDSDLKDWPREYFGGNLERLIKIKKKYDPNKVFRYPQGLSELLIEN